MKVAKLSLLILALSSCELLGAPRRGELVGDLSDAAPELAELNQSLLKLRQEINCLNLTNGLHLTQDQVQQILAIADERKRLRLQYAKRAESDGREMRRLFTDLKDVLESREQIPNDMARRVHTFERRNLRVRNRLAEDLGKVRRKLDDVLTDSQLQVVETFKPCILPPRDLRDPLRAGQASDAGRGKHVLRRVRNLPDHVYRRARERMVERQLRHVQQAHGKYTTAERAKEKARIQGVLDKARSMSDVDFEMNKTKLAQQLKPKDKIGELVKQIQDAKPGGGKSKAARFLLSPAGVAVLKKRAQMTAVE